MAKDRKRACNQQGTGARCVHPTAHSCGPAGNRAFRRCSENVKVGGDNSWIRNWIAVMGVALIPLVVCARDRFAQRKNPSHRTLAGTCSVSRARGAGLLIPGWISVVGIARLPPIVHARVHFAQRKNPSRCILAGTYRFSGPLDSRMHLRCGHRPSAAVGGRAHAWCSALAARLLRCWQCLVCTTVHFGLLPVRSRRPR